MNQAVHRKAGATPADLYSFVKPQRASQYRLPDNQKGS